MRTDQDSRKVNYINNLFKDKFEDKTSEQILTHLKADNYLGVNIGLLEVQVLNFLIQSLKIKKVVEVGALYGYSAYQIAKCLPEDGRVWSIEKNKLNFEKAQKLLSDSDQSHKVEFVFGDAQEKLEQLNEFAPFDMVFIDANKGGYMSYLDWAKDHLKTGGVVVGDNSFLFGAVYDEQDQNHNMSSKNIEVMKSFNRDLVSSEYFETMILPTPEGLTISIKK